MTALVKFDNFYNYDIFREFLEDNTFEKFGEVVVEQLLLVMHFYIQLNIGPSHLSLHLNLRIFVFNHRTDLKQTWGEIIP